MTRNFIRSIVFIIVEVYSLTHWMEIWKEEE